MKIRIIPRVDESKEERMARRASKAMKKMLFGRKPKGKRARKKLAKTAKGDMPRPPVDTSDEREPQHESVMGRIAKSLLSILEIKGGWDEGDPTKRILKGNRWVPERTQPPKGENKHPVHAKLDRIKRLSAMHIPPKKGLNNYVVRRKNQGNNGVDQENKGREHRPEVDIYIPPGA